MEKLKHKLATRKAMLVVIAGFSLVVGALIWSFPPAGSSDSLAKASAVAAWVQGAGTVLAVLASAWVSRDAFDWQQRAEQRSRQESQHLELEVFRDTLIELFPWVRDAHIAACGRDAEFNSFYAVAGAMDMLAIDALVALLQSTQLSPQHGAALVIDAHRARYAAQKAMSLMELLRTHAGANTERPRTTEYAAEMSAHRDVLKVAMERFQAAAERA